jgi:hypothetical protein
MQIPNDGSSEAANTATASQQNRRSAGISASDKVQIWISVILLLTLIMTFVFTFRQLNLALEQFRLAEKASRFQIASALKDDTMALEQDIYLVEDDFYGRMSLLQGPECAELEKLQDKDRIRIKHIIDYYEFFFEGFQLGFLSHDRWQAMCSSAYDLMDRLCVLRAYWKTRVPETQSSPFVDAFERCVRPSTKQGG